MLDQPFDQIGQIILIETCAFGAPIEAAWRKTFMRVYTSLR